MSDFDLAAAARAADVAWAPTVDSTNRWAMDEAARGAPGHHWFVADAQTAGRGRLGRAWFSPPGCNLYASCLLRPALTPAQAPQVALAAALAVRRALAACGVDAGIKWPNDLQVAGKKIAGILCEVQAEPERVAAVVVGVGVNVELTAAMLDPALAPIATSVLLAGGKADRTRVFTALAPELRRAVATLERDGFGALRDEWNAGSVLQDRAVEVLFAGRALAGVVRGLDADGFLLLEGPHGVERIVAGDVTVKK
jgi:BirA family biotin operon repressor/biotin-[acetyl-CoA-carboxylase] ligase